MIAGPKRLGQLHEEARLIAFAQGLLGKVLVCVVAAFLVQRFPHTEVVLPALVLTLVWPAQRRLVLSCAAVYVVADLVLRRTSSPTSNATVTTQVLASGLLLLLAFAVFRVGRAFERLPAAIRRHPLLWLNLAFWLLAAALWSSAHGSTWWSVQMACFGFLPMLLWRASFLMLTAQRGKAKDTRFRDHLFYLWPAFGGTDVPYGKGLDYLGRHEARSPEALARSQLAGLKLLVLACAWTLVLRLMEGVVHGVRTDPLRDALGGFSLYVPHLDALLRREVEAAVPMTWVALYVELVSVTLAIGATGHLIIGCLRLFGFNVWRNTYKPLLAESLVDFWNRFYFYFKELLVELWFYPTYLTTFKKYPRLRTFAAIFSAAFVGNLYYHVLRDRDLVARADLDTLVTLHAPRAFYCLLLTLGVFVSMLRQQARRGSSTADAKPAPWRRAWRIAGVWTFFALIHVWVLTIPESGTVDRMRFVLSLVGLGESVVTP